MNPQQPVINHIAVYVHDLDLCTSFYKNVMQFEQIEEPFKLGMHAWFQIGAHCQLHLIKGNKEQTLYNINNHLAFSSHSIEQFAFNLKNFNVKYFDVEGNENVIQLRPDGVKQIFFKDPEGRWLEINNIGSN